MSKTRYSKIKEPQDLRQVFVIMPFTNTQTRNSAQLDFFFENNIKKPIEGSDLKYKYKVRRSDAILDINAQIVKDLYSADIVICDLSGVESNPNVMYELGIRLGLSNELVLLIREEHKNNKQIFDVNGFTTYRYDPLNYSGLIQHLIREISDYEDGKKPYASPILSHATNGLTYFQTISLQRADLLLRTMRSSVKMMFQLFAKQFSRYLWQYSQTELPESVRDRPSLLEYMEKNREKLSVIDWSNFRVNFGNQPTLDFYLSNQYLNELIDERLEEIFTDYLIAYHSYFVSTNYYQGGWNEKYIYRFVGETNLLLLSTKIIRQLLKMQNEQEQSDLTNLVREVLKSSQIYSFEDNDTPLTK